MPAVIRQINAKIPLKPSQRFISAREYLSRFTLLVNEQTFSARNTLTMRLSVGLKGKIYDNELVSSTTSV